MIADHAEGTIALLRYFLGGNRPSQTDPLTLFSAQIHGIEVRILNSQDWYFTNGSTTPYDVASKPPSYPTHGYSKPNIRLQ